ncbi:thiamine-phosphate kinase [bacterium]|nr:thiamine-phosphate kinase [bacterium]
MERAGGEFDLIRHIQAGLSVKSERIMQGIGDDAAVISAGSGPDVLITTDTLVEQIHFDLSTIPYEDLGWKALAVSLSDVAAMGGNPVCAVVALGVPRSWSAETVDRLYRGIDDCSRAHDCPVAGGDTVRVQRDSVITMTVFGEVDHGRAFLRSGARPGDDIWVTGCLGNSETGLAVLNSNADSSMYSEAVSCFRRPVPRLRESRWLRSFGGVTSMIDISDGLCSEIHHLCRESETGCRLYADRLPLADAAVKWSGVRGQSPVISAMESGEEYELLFTLEPALGARLDKEWTGPTAMTRIGEMTTASSGLVLVEADRESRIENRGWDHFRS